MAGVRTSGSKMRFISDNPLETALKGFFSQAEEAVTQRERVMLIALNEKILARTPVWEGDTIHNWRWSTRAPDTRHEEPIDNGPPGPTNTMPLGQEPRRAVNETRARQSLAGALRAREPQDIYLTNTADSAVGVEYGQLPTPQRSRVDGSAGVLRLAIKEVMEGIL
jgi:hypothetical protein